MANVEENTNNKYLDFANNKYQNHTIANMNQYPNTSINNQNIYDRNKTNMANINTMVNMTKEDTTKVEYRNALNYKQSNEIPNNINAFNNIYK